MSPLLYYVWCPCIEWSVDRVLICCDSSWQLGFLKPTLFMSCFKTENYFHGIKLPKRQHTHIRNGIVLYLCDFHYIHLPNSDSVPLACNCHSHDNCLVIHRQCTFGWFSCQFLLYKLPEDLRHLSVNTKARSKGWSLRLNDTEIHNLGRRAHVYHT